MPPTIPLVQPLGQLLFAALGIYACVGLKNFRFVVHVMTVGLCLLLGLLLHVGSSFSEMETIGTIIRRFCIMPMFAMAIGALFVSSRSVPWEIAFIGVGFFNSVVAYLSFTRIEKTFSNDIGGWIGGGGRVTLNFFDKSSVVFATALVLGASALVVGGLQLAFRLIGSYDSRKHRWLRFLGWGAVAFAYSTFLGLSVFMATRGALFVTAVISCGAIVLLLRKNFWIAITVPVAIIVAGISAFLAVQKSTSIDTDRLLARFTFSELSDSSGTGRTRIWVESIEKIGAEPLGYGSEFGLDIGGFSSHNTLLDIALRMGLPFAFACLGVGCYSLYLAIKSVMVLKSQRKLGYFFSVVFFILYAQFESIASASYHSWVILHVCIGAVIYVSIYGESDEPSHGNSAVMKKGNA
jgi:hypothetical protein